MEDKENVEESKRKYARTDKPVIQCCAFMQGVIIGLLSEDTTACPILHMDFKDCEKYGYICEECLMNEIEWDIIEERKGEW